MSKTESWQPSASIQTLRARSNLYSQIRRFFSERQVLEVETPLLCRYGVTDQHTENISANYATQQDCFLQTSPEYAMKRLLAGGAGSIFQICKAFRLDESGKQHNPEFSLLEWYRVGFDHHQLMDEVEALLQSLLGCKKAFRTSYQNAFIHHVGVDPFKTSERELISLLSKHEMILSRNMLKSLSKNAALQLILNRIIEPQLPAKIPTFIYDFPKNQAALARLSPQNPEIAERFEVYHQGLELANGFCELTDVDEQKQRFQSEQQYRQRHSLAPREIDPYFIEALKHGLPYCSGVAMGLDRLLMLALGQKEICEVISFDWSRI